MADEGSAWVMHGMDWNDPNCIKTYRELINKVNEIGFLPLFKNEIEGFSAEEHVSPLYWWTGDREQDPWMWREIIAGTGEVAYGIFFGRKAGFISMEWLPVFANFRRDGYDFDARWDDELANIRHKRIMDCFENDSDDGITEYTGLQLKQLAGFGKDGYKNFDRIMTDLQMQTYLCIKEFRLGRWTIRHRKNSFRHINRSCGRWRERRLLSVLLISAQISRWITLTWEERIIWQCLESFYYVCDDHISGVRW